MFAAHSILMAILEHLSASLLSASPTDPANIARHASVSSSMTLNHKQESSSTPCGALSTPGTQVAVFPLTLVPLSRLLEGKLLLLLLYFASKANQSPGFLPLGCHSDKSWPGCWNLLGLPTFQEFFRRLVENQSQCQLVLHPVALVTKQSWHWLAVS